MTRTPLPLTWQVGHSGEQGDPPDIWCDATVPGAVQLDVARAEGYGPHARADNWKDYLWMEDRVWTYRARFARPELDRSRLFFVSLGIDYAFEIRLNGRAIHHQEGMYTAVELDLTDDLQDDNELQIAIQPVPKLAGCAGHAQADRSCKPPVSYGWDWHPRLIPLGIWDETFLEIRPSTHLVDARVGYRLDPDLGTAAVELSASYVGSASAVCWALRDPDGRELFRREGRGDDRSVCLRESVVTPRLWWPREQGEQALYSSEVTLLDAAGSTIDRREQRVGFRRVRLVMNEGAWYVPDYPKTRATPPVTMEVNGRRIFCKGTNWVNPDIFYGRIDDERYERLIDLACGANFNMLRVWGGANVNKRRFHELCDERGLMVWQDFPLACNRYEGTPEYLATLRQEATSIIDRLRHHPSLAMWCGGNELFNEWSGMTDQSAALRLLNALCFEQTPDIPFVATAPLMGMGHGHYVFRDPHSGDEVFQSMPRAANTAYTEFGCAGPADAEVLGTIIPAEDLFPPAAGTAWEDHHAFGAWEAAPDSWLMLDTQRHYFGEPANLEELVERGQLLQAEGYRCIFEEARRQWPRASMALNWCFDEPWPTAANNSLISWPARPKPAYHAVRDACRPQMISARLPKFVWVPGERLVCDLFLLNDLPTPAERGELDVWIEGDDEWVAAHITFDGTPPAQHAYIGSFDIEVPAWNRDRFALRIEVAGREGWDSRYTLLLRSGRPA